jgi:hypothetical protein
MNEYPGNKRVRWIDNDFVRFSNPAQDFALNSKVPSNFDIPELHYAFRVHDGYLEALDAEYECVIYQSNQLA